MYGHTFHFWTIPKSSDTALTLVVTLLLYHHSELQVLQYLHVDVQCNYRPATFILHFNSSVLAHTLGDVCRYSGQYHYVTKLA